MPNSELHRIAKGTVEETRMVDCPSDLAFAPDNEFLELVCENGEILMQGQSGSTNKKSHGFSSLNSKAQDKDEGDAVTPKIGGRFGNMDAVLKDFPSLGTSSGHNMGLGQDDDIVPWLNYPLDHDYSSDFFSELTGVNLNVLSSQSNNVVPFDNKNSSSYSQMVRDSNSAVSVHVTAANLQQRNVAKVDEGGGSEANRTRSGQLYPSPSKECQTSIPSLRPRVSDFVGYNTNNSHHQAPNSQVNAARMQKQDQGPARPVPQPSNNGGLMNFSHFSRPAALVKANLQSIGAAAPGPGSSSLDRLRSNGNDKISAVCSSSPVESTLIDLTSGSRSVAGFQNQPVPTIAGKGEIEPSTSKPAKELLSSTDQSGAAICRDDASRITTRQQPDQMLCQTSSFAASTTMGRPDTTTVKNIEPLVASSSMCSGNSVGGPSNDPKPIFKRKREAADESGYQSEDAEEDSMSGKKPASSRGGAAGAKRSRAAEVHNLSERRRRDRINEKMRALQELIPNCNKVDKASMLDEAIEYLKTLQLQVQIMSMGTGLYMPPMMLPTGMQRIPGQHMPHFPPMGMGMGMGMGIGFGMGMLDMSHGSSMMQVPPPMHNVQQFPCPPLSGPSSFSPMPGSNLQMFGLPGQGHPHPMSMPPRAPYVPPSEGPFTKSVPLPNVSGSATAEIPGPASSSSPKDPSHQNMNSHMTHNTNPESPHNNQTSQAKTEGFEQSSMAQKNDPTLHSAATETSTEMGL